MKKIKAFKNTKKNNQKYELDAKLASKGRKPLGKPLHGKFLSLVIKDQILNKN
ncbi:MAG: hypothetical protein NT076_04110 [Candidatus Pacearchaeota archaeon]|nr:hypothetical protein [Candidatus Pacearchaeota archaeon]